MPLQRDDATEDFPVEQRLQPLALGLAQEHLSVGEEPSRESGQDIGEGEEVVSGVPQGYIWTHRLEFQDTVSPQCQV